MNQEHLNICVLCASRENPSGLRATITNMHRMVSGRHNITYSVAADNDDTPTHQVVRELCADGIPVLVWPKERRNSLGSAWDHAIINGVHLHALVTDRTVVLTPYWDMYLADAYEKDQSRIVWWNIPNAGPVLPIVPKLWLEANNDKLFTDYFPFWFDDTWLHEVSAFVHGLPNYVIQATCHMAKKSPVTKRMRDLRFWMDFFIATRPERMEQAIRIRERLGLPEPDWAPIKEWMAASDAKWDSQWVTWERIMGDKSEPDETYIEAKRKAQEFLNAPPGT